MAESYSRTVGGTTAAIVIDSEVGRSFGEGQHFSKRGCIIGTARSMSNALAKHDALLRQHKFVLVRDDKHKVYRNPEGKVYVTAATPSDWRAGFNMLTALKRCIVEPAKPMVIAIDDFEREQAAQLIQGQRKLQHSAHGMGSGKQKHSRGTGFIYDGPRMMTPEEQAIREAQRQQARENAQRRAEEMRQRREHNRAMRQQKRAAAEAAEREFEETYRPFLNVTRRIVDKREADFIAMCQSSIQHRAWSPDLTFYEFPVMGSGDDKAERWAHGLFISGIEEARENGEETTMDYMEWLIEDLATNCSMYVARSEQRVTQVMKFIGRQMAKSNSIWDLQDALSDEMERLDDAMKAWDTARLYGDLDFELDDWLVGLGVNVYEDSVVDVIVHKNEVSIVWDVGDKQPSRHGSRRFDIADARRGG
jgi:hypothetical protein